VQPQSPPPVQQAQAPNVDADTDTPQKNKLGTAGFITSIVGWGTCGFLCPFGVILSLFSVFKQPRKMAIAGLIIGVLGCIPMAIILSMFVFVSTIAEVGAQTMMQMQASLVIDAALAKDGVLPDDNAGNLLLTGFANDHETAIRYARIDDNSYSLRFAGSDHVLDTQDDAVETYATGEWVSEQTPP
jgi:hypothetical protein